VTAYTAAVYVTFRVAYTAANHAVTIHNHMISGFIYLA